MNKKSTISYLFGRIGRRIPALILLCLAHTGSAILGVCFALDTKKVINTAVSGEKTAFIQACLLQAVLILGSLICITLQRWLRDRLQADLDRDWKRDLLHSLLHGDYAAVSDYHTGELLNRLNNDVRIVCDGILSTLPGLLSMVTRMGAVLIVLGTLDIRFTALLMTLAAIVVLTTGLARRKLKSLHKAVSAAEGKASGFMQETLEKLLPVQAMDIQNEVERRAGKLLAERYALQRKRRTVTLIANSGISILSQVSAYGALVWCAYHVLNGRLTFGDLTAITQLVSQLRGPMVNLSGIFPQYIAMTAAAERLMEIDRLCQGEMPTQAAAPSMLYSEMKHIEARNLSFSYGKERAQVLQPGTFTLPKGTFTAITGPSGAGKSTLLKLMLGIYPPQSGELLLGTACGEEHRLDRTTRRLFAYVPQGNLLFSGTLRENLTLTRPTASEAEIQNAIFVSGMDLFLPLLPDGLDTMLGENAHGLSEGQAQRLAIARAVLGGAPILLLDECTSALDAETEQLVLGRLAALPDRTIIAVTHRPAALELADLELELKDGKIIQMQNAE